MYVFDLEHEQKRREQLEKLFNRTKEQVDEELYLIEELKKIEIRKKERERKQQEVNKLLTAVVDLEKSSKLNSGLNQNNLLKNRPTSSITNGNLNKRLKQRRQNMSNDSLNKITAGASTSGAGSLKNGSLNSSLNAAANTSNNSLDNSNDGSTGNSMSVLSPNGSTSANLSGIDPRNRKSLLLKVNIFILINFVLLIVKKYE